MNTGILWAQMSGYSGFCHCKAHTDWVPSGY